MKFFTREASKAIRTKKGEEDWDRRWARYGQHLKQIRPRLSRNWRRVADTDFHDTAIFSFGSPRGNEFIINIDMNPRWKQPPLHICSLHFYGVQKVRIPEEASEEWLIYTEVHAPQKGGAELRGLLSKNTEIRIQAEAVDWSANYKFGDW